MKRVHIIPLKTRLRAKNICECVSTVLYGLENQNVAG